MWTDAVIFVGKLPLTPKNKSKQRNALFIAPAADRIAGTQDPCGLYSRRIQALGEAGQGRGNPFMQMTIT